MVSSFGGLHDRLIEPPEQSFFLLLLRRGREMLAIEVKSTARYHTGLLKGLRAVRTLPRLVRRLLVYTGRRSFVSSDGVEIWPAVRFAAAVADGRLWP